MFSLLMRYIISSLRCLAASYRISWPRDTLSPDGAQTISKVILFLPLIKKHLVSAIDKPVNINSFTIATSVPNFN